MEWVFTGPKQYVGSLPPLEQTNAVSGHNMRLLNDRRPLLLLYDETHDNETIVKKFGVQQMVPLLAQTAYSSVYYGTTKGYDELYQDNVSIFNKDLYRPLSDYKPEESKNGKIRYGIIYRPTKEELLLKDKLTVEICGSWDNWHCPVKLKKANNCVSGDYYLYIVQVD